MSADYWLPIGFCLCRWCYCFAGARMRINMIKVSFELCVSICYSTNTIVSMITRLIYYSRKQSLEGKDCPTNRHTGTQAGGQTDGRTGRSVETVTLKGAVSGSMSRRMSLPKWFSADQSIVVVIFGGAISSILRCTQQPSIG